MIEALLEIIFGFIGEIILELFAEGLTEIVFPKIVQYFDKQSIINSFFFVITYCLLGIVGGGISLILFPELFIRNHILQIINLIITPLIGGLLMIAISKKRQQNSNLIIGINWFSYGIIFALSMVIVRFIWGI